MFISFNSTMLDYYVNQFGLPVIAYGQTNKPIGFIFGEIESENKGITVPCESIEHMLMIQMTHCLD